MLDEKVSTFTGENEWGETVVEEFVVNSITLNLADITEE